MIMKIKIYRGKGRQWRVRFQSPNGRILLDAAGYNTRRAARKSVDRIIELVAWGKFNITEPAALKK